MGELRVMGHVVISVLKENAILKNEIKMQEE